MCQCKIRVQARGGVFEVCARASEAGWMARSIGSSSGLRAPSCSRGGRVRTVDVPDMATLSSSVGALVSDNEHCHIARNMLKPVEKH